MLVLTSYGPRREPGVRANGDAIIRADRLADGLVLPDAAGFTNRGTLAIGLVANSGEQARTVASDGKALNPYPEPR